MRESDFTIAEFVSPSGRSPIRDLLSTLDDDALARACALLRVLAERGPGRRPPHSKPLGDGLFELRDLATGIRIFYAFETGRRIVLLDGIVKKRRDIPRRVMERLRGLQAAVRRNDRKQTD